MNRQLVFDLIMYGAMVLTLFALLIGLVVLITLACILIYIVGLIVRGLIHVAAVWLVRKWRMASEWWARTSGDMLAQQRRAAEEDCRRLGAVKMPEWPKQ